MTAAFRTALPALCLSACSSEQAYNAAQGWQRQQCGGIADKAEFDRCVSRAGDGYDSYKRQTEPVRK